MYKVNVGCEGNIIPKEWVEYDTNKLYVDFWIQKHNKYDSWCVCVECNQPPAILYTKFRYWRRLYKHNIKTSFVQK